MGFKIGHKSKAGPGRPVADFCVRKIAKSYTVEAIKTLHEIMTNEATPAAARVQAADSILNRGWGRPSQEITGDISLSAGDSLTQLIANVRCRGEQIAIASGGAATAPAVVVDAVVEPASEPEPELVNPRGVPTTL